MPVRSEYGRLAPFLTSRPYRANYLLRGALASIPHVGLSRQVGWFAVQAYRRATPVVTGRMRRSWKFDVSVSGGTGIRQIAIAIYNNVPYASFVVAANRARFLRVRQSIVSYNRAVWREAIR